MFVNQRYAWLFSGKLQDPWCNQLLGLRHVQCWLSCVPLVQCMCPRPFVDEPLILTWRFCITSLWVEIFQRPLAARACRPQAVVFARPAMLGTHSVLQRTCALQTVCSDYNFSVKCEPCMINILLGIELLIEKTVTSIDHFFFEKCFHIITDRFSRLRPVTDNWTLLS